MKICKIFFLCAVVVLVLGMIAFPVMADEVFSVDSVVSSDGFMYSFECPVFRPGIHADVDMFYYDTTGKLIYMGTSSLDFERFELDGETGVFATNGVVEVYQIYSGDIFVTILGIPGMDLPEGMPVSFVCALTDPNYTKNTMVNSFNYLLKWAGMVVSGIISGPMSGLLGVFVIGIAVCAVLLAVKIIRSFLWK